MIVIINETVIIRKLFLHLYFARIPKIHAGFSEIAKYLSDLADARNIFTNDQSVQTRTI